MSTETDHEQGEQGAVWVEEYTTSVGTHVAGHWRKRAAGGGTSAPGAMDHDPAAGPPLVTQRPGGGDRESRVAAGLAALRKRREALAQQHGEQRHGAPDLAPEPAAEPAPGPRTPPTKHEAYGFLGSLRAGDRVLYGADGREREITVQESLHRPAGVGSWDGDAVVKVGYGPGRWNTEISAGTLALGNVSLRRGQQLDEGGESQPPQVVAAPTEGTERCPDCGQFQGSAHTCPTPPGLPAGDYAGLKGEDRVKAMVADLEESVKAVVESGQLHRWLDAMSSNGLSRWSANNRLLAVVQILQRGGSLEELHLMGFRQWEKFNRRVANGAKAVWILAPVTRKLVEEDDEGRQVEKHRVVGFKGVPVFNVTDTEGEPMPSSPVQPAPGEATPGTLQGLRERVTQAGYAYEESEIPDCRPATGEGTLGYTEPGAKRIVVDSRLSDAQKASTIAHELGHVHCGHVDGDYSEYQRHRGRMETEAEMTAYLVNRSRGMSRTQVDSFSPGYIAAWSKGDSAVMHTAIDKAARAHSKILDGSWPTS